MATKQQLLAALALLAIEVKGEPTNKELEAALKAANEKLIARATELEIAHEGVEPADLLKAVQEADAEFAFDAVGADADDDTSDDKPATAKAAGKPKEGEKQVKFLRKATVRDHNDEIEQEFEAGGTYNLPIASADRWIRRNAAVDVNA